MIVPFDIIFALLDSHRPVTERSLYARLSGKRGDREVIAATCAALVERGYADRRTRPCGTHEYSISQA